MLTFKALYRSFSNAAKTMQDAALLLARLTLAYGFYEPAMNKWGDIGNVAAWFEGLGIPLPTLSAYLAATTELLGVILLSLGLLTRFISLPLIVVMLVAIATVHWGNGFSCGENGFEIPLYYLLFLLILTSHGAGRWSLDRFWFEKAENT